VAAVITTFLVLAAILAGSTLGVVAASVSTRRRFARSATTFACKVRSAGDSGSGERPQWPRRPARATWVHQVLLVQQGLLFPRVLALPVRIPEDVIREASFTQVRRLGYRPVVIRLRLDDGPLVDVAAAGADRTLLAGPFLAAAIPGLPRGRRERPNLDR
jgi:hypothetical protein